MAEAPKRYKVIAPYITVKTATPDGTRYVGLHLGAVLPSDVPVESIDHHLETMQIELMPQAEAAGMTRDDDAEQLRAQKAAEAAAEEARAAKAAEAEAEERRIAEAQAARARREERERLADPQVQAAEARKADAAARARAAKPGARPGNGGTK